MWSRKLDVTLPIDRMKSFHPDEIVKHVPKLKALLLLKTLLVEMQSNIDNRKDLRRELYELFSKPEALKELLNELKGYECMRLPSGDVAAKSDAPAAAAGKPAAGSPPPGPLPPPPPSRPPLPPGPSPGRVLIHLRRPRLLKGLRHGRDHLPEAPLHQCPARSAQASEPMILSNFGAVVDEQQVTLESRFLSSLAALLQNVAPVEGPDNTARFDKGQVLDVISRIDRMIDAQMNEILHNETFQKLESSWRGLDDLVSHTNFKAEHHHRHAGRREGGAGRGLREQLEQHLRRRAVRQGLHPGVRPVRRPALRRASSACTSSPPRRADITWLQRMGKVANAAHAPFISAVSHKFFGCETIEEIEAHQEPGRRAQPPAYGRWNALRDTEEAAYVGLTLPALRGAPALAPGQEPLRRPQLHRARRAATPTV